MVNLKQSSPIFLIFLKLSGQVVDSYWLYLVVGHLCQIKIKNKRGGMKGGLVTHAPALQVTSKYLVGSYLNLFSGIKTLIVLLNDKSAAVAM